MGHHAFSISGHCTYVGGPWPNVQLLVFISVHIITPATHYWFGKTETVDVTSIEVEMQIPRY